MPNSSRAGAARKIVPIVLLISLTVVLVAAWFHPASQWRLQTLLRKAKGEIPSIPAGQLVSWMKPGSPVYLEGLAEQPSPGASIRNLFEDSPENRKVGEALYQRQCTHCHGGDARGGSGPNLLDYLSRSTDWDFFSTVKWGRSGTAMAAQPVSDAGIWQIHLQLRGLARTWAKEHGGESSASISVNVSAAQLADARAHPSDWLSYTGDLKAHRHSSLAQINRQNVADLRVAWTAQLRPSTKPLAATPIVVNGTIFVTEAPDGVVALDARDGRTLWRFRRPIDVSKLPLCCGAFNRGVAVAQDRLYLATLDARLIALDAATGEKVWEAEVADPAKGYSMTNAPLVVDGRVLVGVAGGEFGIRGFVAAFSADDGKRLWQFDAIPGPGEPGHDTWTGDSWKIGGASTWMTGVYDRDQGLVLWTIGNPWPPLDQRTRMGDNLYSNSIVALDLKSGKLKWYYQFTPADTHDWDATQQIILADIELQGRMTPVALVANRNAYYYVIDRRDGRFIYAKPFVKQTWNRGFDAKGRPDRDPASEPSKQGTLVWPWMHGGTNWWSPSYDEKRRLHFVPTVDAATQYFSIDMKYEAATMTMGGTTRLAANQPAIMAVKAIDPVTGDVRWSTRLDRGDFHQFSRIAGLLSTAGGLVFAGFEDRLFALDSDTGKELWKFHTGGLSNSGSATYLVDGVQYFTIISGNVLFAFRVPPGR